MRAEMDTEVEEPAEQLDPLVLGCFGSAPLADATRRVLLEQQTAFASLENAEKMAERAQLMFMTLENGPHASGMLPCRHVATNGLLELVSKAAHSIWTAHRSKIQAKCPELWDEELLRGWLVSDALGRWQDTGAAARSVGKRAAAQVVATSRRAHTAGPYGRPRARGRGPKRRGRKIGTQQLRLHARRCGPRRTARS